MVLPGPVHAAFLDLIDFGSGPEDCWLWTGPTQGGESAGYGLFSIPGGGRFYVHRLAFATFAGPLLPGMHVLHSCDTPLCCNWTRCLRQGTHAENMADVAERGRWGGPRGFPTGDEHWSHRRPDLVVSGDRHGMARLAADDVAELRRRREAGEMLTVLAAEFEISYTHAKRIMRGASWRTP